MPGLDDGARYCALGLGRTSDPARVISNWFRSPFPARFSLRDFVGAKCKARLTLLHAVPDLSGEAVPSKEARLEAAREQLRALVPANAGLVDEPDIVVGFGTPANRILAVAGEQSADLIVLGLRQPEDDIERPPLDNRFRDYGKAGCGVLTVRAPAGVD